MDKKSKDDNFFLFQRAKISKREANRAGVGFVFGLIGAAIAVFLLGPENKMAGIIVCIFFVAVGYFWIGNKIFKS